MNPHYQPTLSKHPINVYNQHTHSTYTLSASFPFAHTLNASPLTLYRWICIDVTGSDLDRWSEHVCGRQRHWKQQQQQQHWVKWGNEWARGERADQCQRRCC